jgi:flavodoxin
MNTLVVYDSQYGNTEQIAQAIAQTLGVYGFARALRVEQAKPADLDGVHLLIFGSPTQGWHATGTMRSFLAALPPDYLERAAVACFDTRFGKPRWLTGSAAHNIAKLIKRTGGSLLVPPESFFVEESEGPLADGEIERAKSWAHTLFESFELREALVYAI